jgi:hypothetical protein
MIPTKKKPIFGSANIAGRSDIERFLILSSYIADKYKLAETANAIELALAVFRIDKVRNLSNSYYSNKNVNRH